MTLSTVAGYALLTQTQTKLEPLRTNFARCEASQTEHKYHSACICARTKFTEVVVIRLGHHTSPPPMWRSRRVTTTPAYVAMCSTRCSVSLSRVEGARAGGARARGGEGADGVLVLFACIDDTSKDESLRTFFCILFQHFIIICSK